MSKSKNTLFIQNPLPSDWDFFTDTQGLNAGSPHEKWSDPQYAAGWGKVRLLRESKKLVMCTASEVVSEPKRWIYPDWLQQSELTGLAGPPGAGKTTFACALAAGITRGKTYSLAPGLAPTGTGHVIIVNREDNIATSLTPRLEAAGADLARVHFVGCKGGVGEDSPFSFANERDLARLEGLAEILNNNLGLIIVDPIYFAVDGDANNNFKAREAYERLAKLAKRLTCAILGIAHTVRNTQNKQPLARVAGPPALREVPRAFMLLSKIMGGPTALGSTHVLVHAKNNEGKLDGGYEYRQTTVDIPNDNGSIETTKLIITAQLTDSADDILTAADRGRPAQSLLKSEIAVKFLRDVLAEGPQLKLDVLALAEEAGVRTGTLLNAKAFLKIVTKKRHGDGRSMWRLPDSQGAGNTLD